MCKHPHAEEGACAWKQPNKTRQEAESPCLTIQSDQILRANTPSYPYCASCHPWPQRETKLRRGRRIEWSATNPLGRHNGCCIGDHTAGLPNFPSGYDEPFVAWNSTLDLTIDKYDQVAHLLGNLHAGSGLASVNRTSWPNMHFAATSVFFGLLATIHAVSSPLKRCLPETPPPRSSEFSLAMKLNGRNGTFAPLNAVYIENRGLLLRAANTTDSPGSPGAPLTPAISWLRSSAHS